jgi:hypothetical protein
MKTFVTACLVLATTTLAHAESLEEKQYWKREQNYMDRVIASADKQCGTKLTLEWIDKPTLRAETEKTNHSPYGVCSNIINQVEMICRAGDDEKATVKAKIKGFQCGFAKERTLDLKGGIVKYMGNNNQANFSDWAKPWLLKRL